jgi:hypothetical protein
MVMVQSGNTEAAGANIASRHQQPRDPRRYCTTLLDLIASIQAQHVADTATADAVVLRLLREQRVTFLNAAVWHEVAAMSEG